MPSIIEVDTIKNKTGTQNTVLSTDGSGNNTLNAGVIKSNTGSNTGLTIASDGQITVNQNNPTVTLGSNATFPDGHIVQVKCAYDTDQTDFSANTTPVAIANLKCNITPKSASNTMFIHGHFYAANNVNYNGGYGLSRRLASASFSSSDTKIGSLGGQGISTSGQIRAETFISLDDPISNDPYSVIQLPYGYIDSGYDTTSELTYQMIATAMSSITYSYNKPSGGTGCRGVCTMYIFEIQGTVAIT